MEPLPVAYTHVHRAYRRRRASTGRWSHVQGPTHTCTGRKDRNGRVKPHKRAQGVQAARGRYRHVEPSPGVYTHVHRPNRSKRAGTGTRSNVKGPTHTCTTRRGRYGPVQAWGATSSGLYTRAQGVQTENRPKRAGTGTLSPVWGPKRTCTEGTGQKGPVGARGATSIGRNAPVQARPATVGTNKQVHRAYNRSLQWLDVPYKLKRAGTGTCSHVQGPTHVHRA